MILDLGVNFFPSMPHMDMNKGNIDSLQLNERGFFLYKKQKTHYKALNLLFFSNEIISISADGDNTVKICILLY